jgi:acetyl-CoA C-acetyltransferase
MSYTLDDIDPRTPVLVGGGQSTERLDAPDYQALSPVGLATAAAQRALADTGADPAAVAAAIDTVAGIRQFETSVPQAVAPLGRADNYPRAVATRVGADPGRAILEVSGGQAPQHMISELGASIAAGETEVALVFGSEAISTVRHLAKAEDKPDWSETVGGSLDDRGYGLQGVSSPHLGAHGLADGPGQYAILENARRARLKQTRDEYAAEMGALFAPFTKVAATNPFASAPVERSATELITPTEANRIICEPYPRYIVARDQVNQGAAVVLMSVAAARRLGVPQDRWVFLHGHADLREPPILRRADLSRSQAAVLASEAALAMAGLRMSDVDTIDLYSCFPIPVFNIAEAFDIAPDDPRGMTLSGGLPFFGGAGNNYSMHAVIETVDRARANPGSVGFVGANGGVLTKYSVGIYSTAPAPWRADRSQQLQAELDARPTVEIDKHPAGPATIETYTVRHSRDGKRTGIVIGRLDADNHRFVAAVAPGADDLLDLLSAGDPFNAPIYVRALPEGNRVASSKAQLDDLVPVRKPGFRDDYEHVLVRRDGHLLEVTINRPDALNALHPPANAELDEIFDAYFADPELWVAILAGAGDRAFSAGNDLVWSASGKPLTVPINGFAGLTSRRELPKPVIAAVNGYAMGGGCEIALACHLIVADENAKFALSEVRVGLVAGAGGLIRLPRTVPPNVAREMILTGRRLAAHEAQEWGLVNRVVDAGTALPGARELAAEILAGSPTSVRISLQIMRETQGIADTIEAVNYPTDAIDDLLVTEDAKEGPVAFAQRRAPNWRNR